MDDLRDFVKTYGTPKVVVASTIKDGRITLIPPVPTICGPEVHCAPDMHSKVIGEIRSAKNNPPHTIPI